MYRIFYNEEFKGVAKNYPNSKEKHYIFDTHKNLWSYSYQYGSYYVGTRSIPPKYLLLNLLLGNSTCTESS